MARKHTESTELSNDITLDSNAEDSIQQSTELAEAPRSQESLASAIGEGVRDARAAVNDLFPAVGGLLRKGVFNGVYYLTYGVVFGGLTVGRLIPKSSAVADGIREGAKAARHDFDEQSEKVGTAASSAEGLAAT